MSFVPKDPSGGGSRQQRAAQIRADMESKRAEAHTTDENAAQAATDREEEKGTGPVGQGDYLVKDGDSMASIAKDTGHFWETIWNHPDNAGLKEVRQDPNILLPDDRVTIPQLTTKQEPGETEMRHRFVRCGEPASLPLGVLKDGEPRGNQPYQVDVDGTIFTGTTDPDGRLAVPIPGNARKATLLVGPPEDHDEYVLALGTVSPITELDGVQDRLTNLGFECGPTDSHLGPSTVQALRSFQEVHALPVTGTPDQATRDKLLQLHGS